MPTFEEISRELATGELRLGPNDIQPQGNGNARQTIQRRFQQIASGFALLRVDVRPFHIDAPISLATYPVIVSLPKNYEVVGFNGIALAGTATASLTSISGTLPGFGGILFSPVPVIVRPGTFPLVTAGNPLSIAFGPLITATNLTINVELRVP